MPNKPREPRERKEERPEVIGLLRCVCHELRNISEFLRTAKSLEITQMSPITGGGAVGTINGIQAGGTGTFSVSPLPAGSQLQAGDIPVWSVDNTADVSLTASTDGMKVSVAVSATTKVTTFNLTVTAVSLSGAKLSKTVAVPILPAAAVPATDLDINQLS